MPEFIYSMHNVRKALGDKVVLDNITLSFYPGAKIGVVGPNGIGKSTLLKLMAGIEKPNNGDAMLAKDATVGILLQEPPLTEGKTVLENVEEGVADIKALQARMDELGIAMGEPDADFDAADGGDGGGPNRAGPSERLGYRLSAGAGHGCAALPAARRPGGPALWR